MCVLIPVFISFICARFTHPDTPDVIIFEQLSPPPVGTVNTSSLKLHSVCPSPRVRSISQTLEPSDCEICEVDSVDPTIEGVGFEDDVEDIFQLPEELTALVSGGMSETGDTCTEDGKEDVSRSPTIGPPLRPPSSPLASQPLSIPQIQFATIEKLVERLTYPAYSDVYGLSVFLLAYRRFISAEGLLDLLIERFNVPDPVFTAEEHLIDSNRFKLESPAEHMLRRFRSGYKRRVQAR